MFDVCYAVLGFCPLKAILGGGSVGPVESQNRAHCNFKGHVELSREALCNHESNIHNPGE